MRFLLGMAVGGGLTGYFMWTRQRQLTEAVTRLQAAYDSLRQITG